MRRERPSRALLLAALAAIAAPSALPAHASGPATAAVTTPTWWNGMCDRGRNAGSYVGPVWNGLISCGGGSGVVETSPLYPNLEWQCVELSERWLYQEFSLPPVSGDGWQVADNYAGYLQTHSYWSYLGGVHIPAFRRVTPGGRSIPAPGDVISYDQVGGDAAGHTAVVESATVDALGNGHYTILQENTSAVLTLPITNWQEAGESNFSGVVMPVRAWLDWNDHSHPITVQGAGGVVENFSAWNGHLDSGHAMMAGTSPVTAMLADGSGIETAYQGSDGDLHAISPSGTDTNLHYAMRAHTSPAITALARGGYAIAFQTGGGTLATYDTAGGLTNWSVTLDAHTSPAISGLRSGGYAMAGTTSGDVLAVYDGTQWTTTAIGVAPGSGPAVAGLPGGGYAAAYVASGSALLTIYNGTGATASTISVAAGSSPAIAPVGTTYEAAATGADSHLWVFDGSAATDSGVIAAAASSPSIGALAAGGWEAAVEAAGGDLDLYTASGIRDTGVVMLPGTAPGEPQRESWRASLRLSLG